MAASDHLNPQQFMYHATSPSNRDSIAKNGLQVKYDQGGGYTDPGVYMSPNISPHHTTYEDVWKVNVAGMQLHHDPYGDEGGGEKYTQQDVHPSRLSLHIPATTQRPRPSH